MVPDPLTNDDAVGVDLEQSQVGAVSTRANLDDRHHAPELALELEIPLHDNRVGQKGRPVPGTYGTRGSAPTSLGTRGSVPLSNGVGAGAVGAGAVGAVVLGTTLSCEPGVVVGAALAMGARPIAPPIAAAANHGAMYLIVVIMVLSSQVPGRRIWLSPDHCFPANRCRRR